MHLREQRLRLLRRLALQRLGHQRGRRGGDGAAAALEARRLDHAVGDVQMQRQAVAAQRVEALGMVRGLGQRAEVVRAPAVVDDDFLVKVTQIRHR